MAKFIKILAASVGGGILFGAGIRLGEAMLSRDAARPPDGDDAADDTGKLAARLGALEDRLIDLEEGNAVAADSRMARQAAEVETIKSELSREDRQVEALRDMGLQLRVEMRGWLEESVGSHMAGVESNLRAESERGQKEMLDAFADGVQTRVMHRISRLEEEVAGQSAAMTELRDCSLRTEQSLQKLLGGLDRLIVQKPAQSLAEAPVSPEPAALNGAASSDSEVEVLPLPLSPPPAPEPKTRRWSLFG